MLGHATPAITLSVYTHLFPADLRTVADKLDREARRARALDLAAATSLDTLAETTVTPLGKGPPATLLQQPAGPVDRWSGLRQTRRSNR